jgi:hypothetical protein
MSKKLKVASRKRVVRSAGESDLDKPMKQKDFAALSGISQQDVSRLLQCCVLSPNGTACEWMQLYTRFLMGQIFAKGGWTALENYWR